MSCCFKTKEYNVNFNFLRTNIIQIRPEIEKLAVGLTLREQDYKKILLRNIFAMDYLLDFINSNFTINENKIIVYSTKFPPIGLKTEFFKNFVLTMVENLKYLTYNHKHTIYDYYSNILYTKNCLEYLKNNELPFK